MSLARARFWADCWGAQFVNAGSAGHISTSPPVTGRGPQAFCCSGGCIGWLSKIHGIMPAAMRSVSAATGERLHDLHRRDLINLIQGISIEEFLLSVPACTSISCCACREV